MYENLRDDEVQELFSLQVKEMIETATLYYCYCCLMCVFYVTPAADANVCDACRASWGSVMLACI